MAFLNPSIFAGILFYGLSTSIWIYALSKESLVNVYAFTALTFVLVYLGGVLFLGEHLGLVRSIGVAIILVGLLLITWPEGTTQP